MYELLTKSFPDYSLHSLPFIPIGWIDVSYKNDSCPSFLPSENSRITVYVDYEDHDQREAEMMGRPRYSISIDAPGLFDETKLESNSWDDILHKVQVLDEVTKRAV